MKMADIVIQRVTPVIPDNQELTRLNMMSSPISTCECLEEPVSHIHSLVAAESELGAEAVEVLQRLGGHVVEVAEMPHL